MAEGAVDESGPLRLKNVVVGTTHGADHFLNGGFQLIYPLMITDLGLSIVHLGFMEAGYEATSGFLQFVHGWLSRRVNKRVLLGAGSLLESLAGGLTALSAAFPQVVATRVAAGVGSSTMHPVGVALMMEGAGRNLRGRLIGTFSSLGNIGSLAAPLLVGLALTQISWRATLLLISIPSLLVGLLLLFLFRTKGETPPAEAGSAVREWGVLIRDRSLMALTGTTVLARVYSLGTYFPAFFLLGLGLDLPTATLLFLVFRLGRVPGPYLFGLLSDRTGRKPMMILSLLASSTLLYVMTVVSSDLLALGAVVATMGITSAAANVIIQAHIVDSTPPSFRGPVLGIYFTLSEGLGALWTTLLGVLIAAYGFPPAFSVMALASFGGGLVAARIRTRLY